MPTRRLRSARPISPWRVFALSLLVAFVIEGIIMLVLPRVRRWPEGSPWDSVIDATALALAFAPTLWFLAVRPLRNLSRDRGEMLGRIMAAQDEERRRFARDLHDALGQHLTALRMGLLAAERGAGDEESRRRAADLGRLAADSLDEVRRLARGLAPPVLEDFGLSVAIRRLCEDFRSAHGVEVTLTDEWPDGARLDPAVEATAYRLVQESLTNVARHAAASRVAVTLRAEPDRLRLTIRDDGRGFDPGEQRTPGQGLGLRSIQERAAWAGGEARISSTPGRGTIVEVWLPARPTDARHGEDQSSHRG